MIGVLTWSFLLILLFKFWPLIEAYLRRPLKSPLFGRFHWPLLTGVVVGLFVSGHSFLDQMVATSCAAGIIFLMTHYVHHLRMQLQQPSVAKTIPDLGWFTFGYDLAGFGFIIGILFSFQFKGPAYMLFLCQCVIIPYGIQYLTVHLIIFLFRIFRLIWGLWSKYVWLLPDFDQSVLYTLPPSVQRPLIQAASTTATAAIAGATAIAVARFKYLTAMQTSKDLNRRLDLEEAAMIQKSKDLNRRLDFEEEKYHDSFRPWYERLFSSKEKIKKCVDNVEELTLLDLIDKHWSIVAVWFVLRLILQFIKLIRKP